MQFTAVQVLYTKAFRASFLYAIINKKSCEVNMESSAPKETPFTAYQKLLNMINSAEYLELAGYYQGESFMDIAGVGRRENSHSSFLAWLLNPGKGHGLGTYAMEKLLQTALLACDSPSFEDQFSGENNFFNRSYASLHQAIRSLNYHIRSVNIATEWLDWDTNSIQKGDDAKRLDIWAKIVVDYPQADIGKAEDQKGEKNPNTIILALENKVGSRENISANEKTGVQNQTEKYWELLKSTYKDKDTVILALFLTPMPPAEYKKYLDGKPSAQNGAAKSKQYLTINYQYLLDNMLQPCYIKATNKHTKIILDDYIRCLGRATIAGGDEKTERKNKEVLVLATSLREKELAETLCKKHTRVLSAILEAAIACESNTASADESNGGEGSGDFPYAAAHYLSTKDFYCSLFLSLMQTDQSFLENDSEFKDNLDEFNEVKQKSANAKPYFYFGGIDENVGKSHIPYISKKHWPRSLGALAFTLIKTWVEKEKPSEKEIDVMIKNLRHKINPAESPGLWLALVCIKRGDYIEKIKSCFESGNQNATAEKFPPLLWPSRYFIDNKITNDKGNVPHQSASDIENFFWPDEKYRIKTSQKDTDDLFVGRWWGEASIGDLLNTEPFSEFYKYDDETSTITIR